MLIRGNIYQDQRGIIHFVNDFSFDGVKRFYTITHPYTNTIRAWQGHKYETKYFFVVKGSFIVNWIAIDDWSSPSKNLPISAHILTHTQSEILTIPPGHVNGFQALEPDSILIVFSDKKLDESTKDDFRFSVDYWKIVHK